MVVSDEELLVASVDDEEAFAAFYRRHARPLAGFFMRRTGDAELAADLTAETFAAALAARRRFDPAKGPATGWLYGIARHTLARTLRHRRVENRARRTLGMALAALDDEAVELVVTAEGDVVQLRQRLPADQRAAIEARVLDEQEYEQIADLMTDFFDDLERELRRAHRRDTAQRVRSGRPFLRRHPVSGAGVLRPLAALAVIVALVAVVLVLGRKSDIERPAATAKQVVTNVGAGIRFSLDGRVLTVRLRPSAPTATLRRVSGARISATCGAKIASPPGDARSTTLTRRWPAGETSLRYRFRRDVSEWCRLADPVGRSVAVVTFPGASPGAKALINDIAAKALINDIATNWARWFASNPRGCKYMGQPACERLACQRVGAARPIPNCTRPSRAYRQSFRDAVVQDIAINGDRAAARLSNGETVELQGGGNVWGVAKFGENAGRGLSTSTSNDER